MDVRETAKTHTILTSTHQFKKDTTLQPLIPLHFLVSPIRSSSKNRSSSTVLVLNHTFLIWWEEIPGESGIFGRLGAKTCGARHHRKVVFLNFLLT